MEVSCDEWHADCVLHDAQLPIRLFSLDSEGKARYRSDVPKKLRLILLLAKLINGNFALCSLMSEQVGKEGNVASVPSNGAKSLQ
jgi:hypothetical protein